MAASKNTVGSLFKKAYLYLTSRRFWNTPIKHEPYELFCMRLMLVYILWKSFIFSCRYTRIVIPTGLSYVFDFSVLCWPSVQNIWQLLFLLSSFLYTVKIWTFPSLVVMFFIHNGMMTLNNSQGSTGHTYQILTIIILVQMVHYGIERVKALLSKKKRTDSEGLTEDDLAVFYTQQALIAIYVMAAITKYQKSGGEWCSRTLWIVPQLVKANDMRYFNHLDSGFRDNVLAQLFVNVSLKHPVLPLLMFGGAFYLELFAFLALFNRATLIVGGVLLWLLHWGIKQVMTLDFTQNQQALVVYFFYLPYLAHSLYQRLAQGKWPASSAVSSPRRRENLPSYSRGFQPRRSSFRATCISMFWRVPWKVGILMLFLFYFIGENYPFSHFPMYSAQNPYSYLVYITDSAGQPLALNRDHKVKASHVNKYLKNVKAELLSKYQNTDSSVAVSDDLSLKIEKEAGDVVMHWFIDRAKRAYLLSTRKPLHLYWRDIVMDEEKQLLNITDRLITSLPCTYADHLECRNQQLSCCNTYVNDEQVEVQLQS